MERALGDSPVLSGCEQNFISLEFLCADSRERNTAAERILMTTSRSSLPMSLLPRICMQRSGGSAILRGEINAVVLLDQEYATLYFDVYYSIILLLVKIISI